LRHGFWGCDGTTPLKQRKLEWATRLVNGANIAGFLKVANSMLDQGLV